MLTLDDLSPSQREVALLVAEGLTNRAIAERRYCSESTVKNHLVHIADLMESAGLLREQHNPRTTIARWIWEQQVLAGLYPEKPAGKAA